MRNKKLFIGITVIAAAIAGAAWLKIHKAQPAKEQVTLVAPAIGSIENTISTTATVLPKNRLAIKPPVNGRVEELKVSEGQKVKAGTTLAWMSSTERAALLDAAAGQGAEKVAYWKDVYKAIPLIAPIDGEIIVATVQPGQTVTAAEAVVVLSDRLILRAQVDETDIGKIKLKQRAEIFLDAYPDTKIKAVVDHIFYESKTSNNVTIYEVDLIPEELPEFFRSGMNATVNFIIASAQGVLLVPLETVQQENGQSFVLVKQPNDKEPVRALVTVGISDEKHVEILSGLSGSDTLVVKSRKYSLPKSMTGTNPFMPSRPRR